jgi:hypothetical protein
MRRALAFPTVAIALMVLVAGCERPEDPMLRILSSTTSQARVDDITRTTDYLFNETQSDQAEFNNSIASGLNRWSGYSADLFKEEDWQPDASISDLLKEYETLPVIERMEGSSFLSSDGQYLQSIAWISQIVNRIQENPHLRHYELFRLMADNFKPDDNETAPVDALVEKLNPGLDADQAKDLSLALQLFDWVIRNIQLEETPSYTDEEREEMQLVEAETLSASGLAEPGAKRDAWQLLVFARGDYIEKAKLFMMMCHQMDIRTVMFATGEDQTPWVVGVLIGEDYYLFDTRLGLPIPGKDSGFATLAEVQADPELLSKLDLSVKESLADDTEYWVKEDDLKNITGLLYWHPVSVSQRTAVLESNLSKVRNLVLTQRADETAAELPEIDNIDYKPWDISLRTAKFRKVLRESLPKSVSDDALAEKLRWYGPEEGYIIQFNNYRTARARFIRGKFERKKEVQTVNFRDAIESFALLMYEDDVIESLKTDHNLQSMIGIRRVGVTPAEFEQDIASRQAQMRLVRRDAGLFMCQSHFDNGSVSTTAGWIPGLLEEPDVDRWEGALNYLNARAHEGQHRYDEAIESYKAEGPQQHGNLIRARLLKEQIETHYTKKKDVK